MGALMAKEDWVDSDPTGEFSCDNCAYRSSKEEWLTTHRQRYHHPDMSMIFYFDCDGSIDGRGAILDHVSAKWIDCTGGQAACEDDGDFDRFAEEVSEASKETGIQVYNILHIADPGLGLEFPGWWVDAGIAAGVFKRVQAPQLDNDQESN